MRPQLQQGQFPKAILVLIIFIIMVNSVVLALAVGLLDLPGEFSTQEQARRGALYIYDYVQDMAKSAGVDTNPAVRDVLAKFRFDIEQAGRPEEIAQIVLKYGRESQDVVVREQDNQRRDLLLSLVRLEPRLQGMTGEAYITVSRREDKGIEIEDPDSILSAEKRMEIQKHEGLQRLSQMVEIKIINGKVELINPISMLERLKRLEHETETLRVQYQEAQVSAGFEPMTGSGIVIRLYDAESNLENSQIVHDFDVRDIVNELFSAGAAGVEVGGQRLTTTSSIRCAGNVILVNQHQIAVNPVTINAVGNPEILVSSLDLIRGVYQLSGIRFEVETTEKLTLPAYGGYS